MTVIKQEDFIQSIFDAFQFISYYHPKDYIQALYKAYQKEENPAAKDAMAQILVNSRMCRRPSSDLSGYRYCDRILESGHGCTVGCRDERTGNG